MFKSYLIRAISIVSLCAILFLPNRINAAEVLQITNYSTLQIGDNNRNYTVRIACLEVEPSKEKEVLSWLKYKLPRRSKVNLQPRGSDDGTLIAKVIPIGSDVDITKELVFQELASSNC